MAPPRSGTPRVRPTARGTGFVAVGAVLAAAGALLGEGDLFALGAAALLLVLVPLATMRLTRLDHGRHGLVVARRIAPNPTVRGRSTTTHIQVGTRTRSTRASTRLAQLRLGEQAAPELCDHDALRARITTERDHVRIRYTIHPAARGRWTLGPLLASRLDVFGVARADQELGPADTVSVWPRTVDLPMDARGALGDLERTGTGARLASTEDTTLREYVPGDDPRRVHWPSAARHGHLLVRTDESGGLPPVTVLLDRGLLPVAEGPAHGPGEWAVECAASIALGLARAGHPVRLLPTGAAAGSESAPFHVGRGHETRTQILNSTLDLRGYPDPHEAEPAITTTLRALHYGRSHAERVIAVLGPLAPDAREAAAGLTMDAAQWAVVLDPGTGDRDPHDTAEFLRGRDWRVVEATDATPIQDAWRSLLEDTR